MPPVYIGDDLDFYEWFEEQIVAGGGYWVDPATPRYEFLAMTSAAGEDLASVSLTNHYIGFHAGPGRLKISFHAVQTSNWSGDLKWNYLTYSYHYKTDSDRCVFRYDKHPEPGFERLWGTDCHVHCGTDAKIKMRPTAVVEVGFVMDKVAEHQETGMVGSYV